MQDPRLISLQRLELAIEQVKPQLITAMGKEGLIFIRGNFDKEGFQGETFKPWKKRKKGDKKGKSRKILRLYYHLIDSFNQTDHPENSVISSDDVKAKIHNEGGEIRKAPGFGILSFRKTKAVDFEVNKRYKLSLTKTQTETQQRKVSEIRRYATRRHNIYIPRRQFAGDSPVLRQACEKAVVTILIRQLKLNT